MEVDEWDKNYMPLMRLKKEVMSRMLITQVRVDENQLKRRGQDLIPMIQAKVAQAMKDLEPHRPQASVDKSPTSPSDQSAPAEPSAVKSP